MRYPLFLAAFALLAFTGCSTISDLVTDYPKEVATLEASLAAADSTAMIYLTLPVCGKTTATLCRAPSVSAKIGTAEAAAYAAVTAAYTAEDETTVEAATTAVGLLQSLVSGLPVTN